MEFFLHASARLSTLLFLFCTSVLIPSLMDPETLWSFRDQLTEFNCVTRATAQPSTPPITSPLGCKAPNCTLNSQHHLVPAPDSSRCKAGSCSSGDIGCMSIAATSHIPCPPPQTPAELSQHPSLACIQRCRPLACPLRTCCSAELSLERAAHCSLLIAGQSKVLVLLCTLNLWVNVMPGVQTWGQTGIP